MAALLTIPQMDERFHRARSILNRLGVVEKLRAALGLTGLRVNEGRGDLKPSANLQILIERAQSEAGAARAGTEHLLVAMSALGQGEGNRFLREAGVTEEEVRRLMLGSPDA